MTLYLFALAAHVCAVTVSGTLFFTRAVAVAAGAQWPRRREVRIASYMVDTLLLSAALTLVLILPKEIFANQWLSVKLGMVISYIAFGVAAMRPSLPLPTRRTSLIAAMAIFLNIIGIAVTHHPFGWFSLWS
jgi:uncharacterized membrane protein SirB2